MRTWGQTMLNWETLESSFAVANKYLNGINEILLEAPGGG